MMNLCFPLLLIDSDRESLFFTLRFIKVTPSRLFSPTKRLYLQWIVLVVEGAMVTGSATGDSNHCPIG